MSTASGLAIMLAVTGFNLLGDGLRDLMDPRNLAARAAPRPASLPAANP
jgi:peptide/nickel transport system permease protein